MKARVKFVWSAFQSFRGLKIGTLIFVGLVAVLVASSCTSVTPMISAAEADLTARRVAVELRRESEVVPVEVDQPVLVEAGDQVRLDETGRALLRFRDDLLVELFRDTEMRLDDVRLEPGGFIFVRLRQALGHSRTRVESLANARVALETDYATIRALDSDTEFLVCQADVLTCMVTVQGEAEVEAQGQSVVVGAGEATYILPGEPPQPVICADVEAVNDWLNRERSSEDVEALGELVAGWPQVACSSSPESASETPSPTETDIAPVEADLTAEQVAVQLERQLEQVPIAVDEHVPVQVGDQVRVDETGRALLRFRDRLLVELFRDTGSVVSDARLEPDGSIFVRLKQTFGFTRTRLESLADARLVVDTDYATIRALDSGTEFLLGHGEPLTCIVPLSGAVEVEAQGETVVVPAGEATYILPGEPPRPLVSANLDEARVWADRKRAGEEVEPLGALVKRWEQGTWSATAQEVPTDAPTAALPSSEGMVSVQGGLYQVGASKVDDYHVASQQIELDGFWIDQYEVTNAQYKAFLDESGRQAALEWPGGTFPAGQENHPVKGVSWDDAAAYCAWENKRLPTEAQWEVAARGPGSEPPLYPWGDDPRAAGQVDQLPLVDTYPVGAMPFNQSAFGVYDMAGNVWEWVRDPYAPVADGYEVLRGGRHGLIRDMAFRQQAEPNDERFRRVAGFRCAADSVLGGN